ncbi:hypothetical protein [Poseidonocella sp. HB161398]|uniref:hypothetical protein n=1 Tax=Poseidonocella sp. HB161398 TaxID=2320855 RepID=UPI001109A05F|nr:hypothetical protein [Poseidonocella sp. HB161398]
MTSHRNLFAALAAYLSASASMSVAAEFVPADPGYSVLRLGQHDAAHPAAYAALRTARAA